MSRRRHPLLLRHEGGTTALEFALIMPVFLLLLLGIVEIGMIMMVDATLESAVREATRFGLTMQSEENRSREEVIRETIDERLAPWLPADTPIDIDVRVYDAFASVGEGEPFADDNGNGQWDTGEAYTDTNQNGQYDADLGRSGAGGRGAIVLYEVSFSRPTTTGIPRLAGVKAFDFQRTIMVQNE